MSAGYDVEAAEDVIVPAFQKPGQKPTLIKTGVKAYFPEDEVYILNRSSNPKRKGLVMANSGRE